MYNSVRKNEKPSRDSCFAAKFFLFGNYRGSYRKPLFNNIIINMMMSTDFLYIMYK